jgi:hypothetical protein
MMLTLHQRGAVVLLVAAFCMPGCGGYAPSSQPSSTTSRVLAEHDARTPSPKTEGKAGSTAPDKQKPKELTEDQKLLVQSLPGEWVRAWLMSADEKSKTKCRLELTPLAAGGPFFGSLKAVRQTGRLRDPVFKSITQQEGFTFELEFKEGQNVMMAKGGSDKPVPIVFTLLKDKVLRLKGKVSMSQLGEVDLGGDWTIAKETEAEEMLREARERLREAGGSEKK